MSWVDSPPGVLMFACEPGPVYVGNLSEQEFQLPEHNEILLAGVPVNTALPTDSAIWLSIH